MDFLKSPSSYFFSTRRTKDFSYLIGANFSDPKTGRCALTNQRSHGYPLGTDLSKLCSTKRDLRLNSKLQKQQLQDALDFKVIKLIFGSAHAILNNYRHIFRRLKSNLKCFFIGESHCVERWRSKWIITRNVQRSFVVAFLRQYMYFL